MLTPSPKHVPRLFAIPVDGEHMGLPTSYGMELDALETRNLRRDGDVGGLGLAHPCILKCREVVKGILPKLPEVIHTTAIELPRLRQEQGERRAAEDLGHLFVFQCLNAPRLRDLALLLPETGLERIRGEAETQLTVEAEAPAEDGTIFAKADRVGLATRRLDHLLVLEAGEELRPGHSIFFVFAEPWNDIGRKTELPALSASPAVNLVVFSERKRMESTTCHLMYSHTAEGLYLSRNSAMRFVILARLVH